MKTELSFQKLLLAFFAFIVLMIIARFIYTGSHGFVFLIWNVFLAWIPFYASSFFKQLQNAPVGKQALLFFTWLLFFPNALYIITDLVHLDMDTRVPKWFDAVLLFTAAVTGLMMGLVSLLRAEKFLSGKFKKSTVNVSMVVILFLGSFGVYLGRFLRWNSWDIVSNPLNLLVSIGQRFIFPFDHLRTWGITLQLTILFWLLYMAVKKLPAGVTTA